MPADRGAPRLRWIALCALILAAHSVAHAAGWLQPRQTIEIRGHQQSLRVYGSSRGDPIIVSSGDGGWIHLAPHVAEFLSARGFFILGFDVRAYLSSFTTRGSTLGVANEPADYRVLIDLARRATGKRPILIGVSEGAGLSVLAASEPAAKPAIQGVIALGLPDRTALGWRWADMLIYLTHQPADEPAFSAAAIVDRVAPLPLAAIHSTHDEFVSRVEVERILQRARDPKRLAIVNASDHRFSDNLAEFDRQLLDAIAWVKLQAPR